MGVTALLATLRGGEAVQSFVVGVLVIASTQLLAVTLLNALNRWSTAPLWALFAVLLAEGARVVTSIAALVWLLTMPDGPRAEWLIAGFCLAAVLVVTGLVLKTIDRPFGT